MVLFQYFLKNSVKATNLACRPLAIRSVVGLFSLLSSKGNCSPLGDRLRYPPRRSSSWLIHRKDLEVPILRRKLIGGRSLRNSSSKDLQMRGFALISTTVALSVLGLSMLTFLFLIDRYNTEIHRLNTHLVGEGLESFFSSVISNPQNCLCHLDPLVNREVPAESLSINTDTPRDIDLKTLRAGCDFSSPNNIIAEAGSEIPGNKNVKVSQIRVSNLQSIDGFTEQYSGDLMIEYRSIGSDTSIPRPISIPLILSIDSNSGTSSSRPITSCKKIDDEGEMSSSTFCYRIDNDSGRTLIGCGGTASTDITGKTTAFGFEAGITVGGVNGPNTYFGYQAGRNHSGDSSTFLGFQAGKDSRSSQRNTFVGYQAGLNAEGHDQVFIGSHAGRDTTTGEQNTFIGASAGKENQTGSQNLFVGNESGLKGISPRNNVFIGYQSGRENESGNENVFLGTQAGKSLQQGNGSVFIGHQAGVLNTHEERSVFIGPSAGSDSDGGVENTFIGRSAGKQNQGSFNTFIGADAGALNQMGEHNVFLGFNSGYNSQSSYNTFLGTESGHKNTQGTYNVFFGQGSGFSHISGTSNTMLGSKAGYNTVNGSHNIFIGYNAGNNPAYRVVSNKFVVGNENNQTWLTGDITPTGNLYVNGQPVVITSSRALKREIKRVENYDLHLESLLETPLFTYYYKDPSSYPHKKRMGIISEKLPQHLQIQEEGRLSRPDWPSIYGSFWAGIKALYQILQNLKEEIFSSIQVVKDQLREIKIEYEGVAKRFLKLHRELAEVKAQLKKTNKEIEKTRKSILLTRKKLSQD